MEGEGTAVKRAMGGDRDDEGQGEWEEIAIMRGRGGDRGDEVKGRRS